MGDDENPDKTKETETLTTRTLLTTESTSNNITSQSPNKKISFASKKASNTSVNEQSPLPEVSALKSAAMVKKKFMKE